MTWHFLYWLISPLTWPAALVSIAMSIFYGVESWRFRDRCLEITAKKNKDGVTRIWGRPGGQCFGCQVIWYSSVRNRKNKGMRVHERIHAIHAMLVNAITFLAILPFVQTGLIGWGWLALSFAAFGTSYGAHFLANWYWFIWTGSSTNGGGTWREWKPAYYRIWTERIAYRLQRRYRIGLEPGAWGSK